MAYINRVLKIVFIFFCVGYITSIYAANMISPIGSWKTIDDVTGQPKSIIKIYANSDQTLSGKVIKLFPKPGEDQNKICEPCKGSRHNQKIVGMVVLEGMKDNGDKWQDGQILDPKNGKTYRCTMRVIGNGSKLQVHGYIGIPAFGRTQVWDRVN